MGETWIEQAPRAIRRRRRTVALVAVVMIAGVGSSFATATAVERAEQRHAGQLMDQHADEVAREVASETARYGDTLSDMAVAVGAQSDFTAGDFTEITSRLSRLRLPGATGMSFAVPADDDQVADVAAVWRARGASVLSLATAAPAPEHMFMIFSRSLDGSPAVPGRDLSQAPQAAEALRIARASGQVTASQSYVLLKDRALPAAQQQMSFVLAAPVYGGLGTPDPGRFRGWMLMAMRGGDFMRETLQAQSHNAVTVTLTDMSTSTPTVVFRPQTNTPARTGTLSRHRSVVVGQHRWQLDIEPAGGLLVDTDRRMPALTFGIGALMTMLVAVMAGVLAGSRNRAMNAVDRATAALRDDIRRREATEAQLRERENDLRHLALHDPLTGLANRALFHERVDHAITTHRRGDSTLSVIYIDLDGFKQVNDAFGHSTGDALLNEAAARLRHCVRAGDTVARLGGDEFAILAEQVSTIDDPTAIADRIIHALQQPYEIDGRVHHVTASAGVAPYRPGTSTQALIRLADEAMYVAKSAGKARYVFAPDTSPTNDLAESSSRAGAAQN